MTSKAKNLVNISFTDQKPTKQISACYKILIDQASIKNKSTSTTNLTSLTEVKNIFKVGSFAIQASEIILKTDANAIIDFFITETNGTGKEQVKETIKELAIRVAEVKPNISGTNNYRVVAMCMNAVEPTDILDIYNTLSGDTFLAVDLKALEVLAIGIRGRGKNKRLNNVPLPLNYNNCKSTPVLNQIAETLASKDRAVIAVQEDAGAKNTISIEPNHNIKDMICNAVTTNNSDLMRLIQKDKIERDLNAIVVAYITDTDNAITDLDRVTVAQKATELLKHYVRIGILSAPLSQGSIESKIFNKLVKNGGYCINSNMVLNQSINLELSVHLTNSIETINIALKGV